MEKQWVNVTGRASGLGRARAVKGLAEFQIPEDMQAAYGYSSITEEDKAKIFGGNLGRLLGIDTTKRRIKATK
jgi:uncharacterized protein